MTICMPSHRNLAGSRLAIESALAYCRARDALLVVSDNSGDPEKRAWLESIGAPLIYLAQDNDDARLNIEAAIAAAPTLLVMPMGDDDQILIDPAQPAFDLSDLPFDYVGVTPVTISFSEALGMERHKAFEITADEAGGRMIGYLEQAHGDNGSFHSIYRRDVFASVLKLYAEAHPTKGNYGDWAILLALAAYGKFAHDPSTVYRYNMAKWDSAEKISALTEAAYTSVGLPPHPETYEKLLQFLDIFIFATRGGTPLSQDERQRLSKDIVNIFLGSFVQQIAENPENYDGAMRHLASMVLEERDSFTQFQIALMMVDRIQPGLKDRYVAFVKHAFQGM
ncbi:hypothetical protein [Rhizobium sp. RU36D]|uniref:hypothetical protein n=1 Tax=Rhizobium sp. RU36D TaxID=1907415 RepID=UPI0015C42564|nr:hypothetical protein [Rhizobium sp. RU36D]